MLKEKLSSLVSDIEEQILMLDSSDHNTIEKLNLIFRDNISRIAEMRSVSPEFWQVNYPENINDARCKEIFDCIKQNSKDRILCEEIPSGAEEIETVGGIDLGFPQFVPWQLNQSKHNFVIDYNKNLNNAESKEANALLLNMIMTMPIGDINFTFVDLCMTIACHTLTSKLPASLYHDSLVMTTQDLNLTIGSLTDRMKLLLPKYGNIEEDNRIDHRLEMPYEVVVLINYPNKISSSQLEMLMPLFENGYKSGIYFVVLNDKNYKWSETTRDILSIKNYSSIHSETSGPALKKIIRHTAIADNQNMREACFKYINDEFDSTKHQKTVAAMPTFDPAKYEDTNSELDVPVGNDGFGTDVKFKFDTVSHCHSFIIGQSGSGKSVLLHDVIINLVQKYKPEDLQLYLLDFKLGGVEFNRYRNLKHIKALLVDNNDNQITLEILRDLREQMKQRALILRNDGVSSIKDYNANHPNNRMPQIIFVADECHALFEMDGSKNRSIQNEILSIITNIAKEGRSQGVHLLMATQTLTGAEISTEILNQITDHYLLKCSVADSEKMVRDSSQITANQSTGQVYYHHTDEQHQFNAFYVDKSKLKSIIERAVNKSNSHQGNGQFYFNGSQIFSIDKDAVKFVAEKGRKHICAAVGKNISLDQAPLSIVLKEDYSENILLFGIDNEEQVTRTTFSTLLTLIFSNMQKQLGYKFYVIDCIDNEDAKYFDILDELVEDNLCEVVTSHKRGTILGSLAKSIYDGSAQPAILVILGQERFRELKFDNSIEYDKTPDYSNENENLVDSDNFFKGLDFTASEHTYNKKYDFDTYQKALKYILDNGPENNIHTILQVNKPSNLLFDDYVTRKSVSSRFKHFIMLKSEENTASGLNLNDDIRLENLSGDPTRLRAYYYSDAEDNYKLFTPYGYIETSTLKNIIKNL